MKSRNIIPIIIAIALACIVIFLVLIFVGSITERNTSTKPTIPENYFSGIDEISSFTGKDCNLSGFADVNCFFDSFNDCTSAIIKDVHTTVEGDPIYTVAVIKSNKDNSMCTITVFEDTTKDRFGVPGITKYTCSSMKLDDKYLNLSPCVDESNNGEYGFVISKP